jgi:hypothetical protein
MRSVFASVVVLGLLIASGAQADAATRHRVPMRAHAMVDPNQGVIAAPNASSATPRFAVPGWSDESTREWIDKASSLVGVGG